MDPVENGKLYARMADEETRARIAARKADAMSYSGDAGPPPQDEPDFWDAVEKRVVAAGGTAMPV